MLTQISHTDKLRFKMPDRFIFQMHLNEHNAPLILPLALLILVLVDRRGEEPVKRVAKATAESSHQLGALLMVMAGSVAFGGIVERSEVMDRVPHDLGSPVVAMAVLFPIIFFGGMYFAYRRCGSSTYIPQKKTKVVPTTALATAPIVSSEELATKKKKKETPPKEPEHKKAKVYQEKKENM